ncbi:aminotransferase-like domain-containing protein [Streptomyces fuscichromogenes]|uniref:GntR family transcriptional regulator n=1 Tax=Streptomyces fuscichromogenes TaxID=1324013 RepID=A0A917XQ65_9ACTN|nr:PLP-dependent aminotransferase family protein [Streptomyces fuscichromogenes]GGN45537.1 GntR family transcriptional regulator [Streptomyces fuscichromogenes]
MELAELNAALDDPLLESMNFLNEVAIRFPDSVSLAAGRPVDDHFDPAELEGYLSRFRRYLSADLGYDQRRVAQTLFQYGRTKGIIHDLIARHLRVDEGVRADPEAIVVTVGAQEALHLLLRALRAEPRDVALAVAPTYVGFTGAARLMDLPVLPVASGTSGVDLADLRARLLQARADGLRPRCLYVVPDFANPTGISLDLPTRYRLLEAAREERLLLIEDNPYGAFTGQDGRLPTLRSLDTGAQVAYVGSFAKTVLPGARVGYVVADQRVRGRGHGYFADELGKIKSMVTVNTSPLSQAIVAGHLLAHDFSVIRANAAVATRYRRNMSLMLAGLERRFPAGGDVTWNVPSGGFFIVLSVPFRADDGLLEHSAREHKVLWTPMSHFYGRTGGETQLRLSCSSLTPEDIETGLDRLAALVAEQRSRAAQAPR